MKSLALLTRRAPSTSTFRRYASAPKGGWSKLSPGTPRILITGALGQIGTELTALLRDKYGAENVIASDVRKADGKLMDQGPFKFVDVTSYQSISQVVVEEHITWIIHLSSVLSAVGERNLKKAIDLNVRGIEHAMEVARENNLRIYAPSSIAAFGPSTPQVMTPDEVIMRPTTIYGVSKVYLELLGEYYQKKFGVDFRSIRYPGILSAETLPGGGTTDYAIDIFYKAVKGEKYTCFLAKDVALPMMYMPDCLRATVQLLEAPVEKLKSRTYNLAAISFTPEEIAKEIKRQLPKNSTFDVAYEPDFRNNIALSWPRSLDDSGARKDWGWKHQYGLEEMTRDMLTKIAKRVKA